MGTLKHSRQRDSIRAQMEGRSDHPTADTVYEEMKQIFPSISLGTVYRNLSLLAEMGEIRKLSGLSGADRFDPRTERHCHFVCEQCGGIQDMDEACGFMEVLLQRASAGFPGGRIRDCSAIFHGICTECLKSSTQG
jgi:Fur family peroxide stress response transcriptional regulator